MFVLSFIAIQVANVQNNKPRKLKDFEGQSSTESHYEPYESGYQPSNPETGYPSYPDTGYPSYSPSETYNPSGDSGHEEDEESVFSEIISVIEDAIIGFATGPYYVIRYGELLNPFINEGVSPKTISEIFDLDINKVTGIWNQIIGYSSVANCETKIRLIYEQLGIQFEEVQGMLEVIKQYSSYIDIPIKHFFSLEEEPPEEEEGKGMFSAKKAKEISEQPQESEDKEGEDDNSITFESIFEILTPISQYWSNFAQIATALNINETKVKAGINEIIDNNETATIRSITTAMDISTTKLLSVFDNAIELANTSTTSVGDVLKFFGIRESSLETLLGYAKPAIDSEISTAEDSKKIAVSASVFAFETIDRVFENVTDILISTFGDLITYDRIPIQERINMITTGLNAINQFLGEKSPEELTQICMILTSLNNNHFDLKTILDLDEAGLAKYNEIVNFAKGVLDGKANFYDVYDFIMTLMYDSQHLATRAFTLLKDKNSTLSSIIDAVDTLDDIIIRFLSTTLQIADDTIEFQNYKLFNIYGYYFRIYNLRSTAESFLSCLSATNVETLKMYRDNISFIVEEFRKPLAEGINLMKQLSNGMLNELKEGKTLEESLQSTLTTISTSECSDIINYLINITIPSGENELNNEVSRMLELTREVFTNAANLNEFYEGVYNLDWSSLLSIVESDPNYAYEILGLFPADRLYRLFTEEFTNLLRKASNYYESYVSAASIITNFVFDNFQGYSTSGIYQTIDWFITFMINGTINPQYYEEMENYIDTIKFVERIAKALGTEGSGALSNFRFDFLYETLNSVYEEVVALNNSVSTAIITCGKPYIWFAKKFVDGFTGREALNIVSKELEPEAIANTLNLFLKYTEPLKTNASLLPVIKENLGVDVETIIAPIKDTLITVHNYIKYDQDLFNCFNDINAFSEKFFLLEYGNSHVAKKFFGIEDPYSITDYDAWNHIVNYLRNKDYLQSNSSSSEASLSLVSRLTTRAENEFDEDFTFKSFIDNNNFVFSKLLANISTGYTDDESIINRIDSLGLTTLSIDHTLESLAQIEIENILNILKSFVYKSDEINELITLATSFKDSSDNMTVSNLNELVHYDLGAQVNSLTTSTITPVSYLPETGSLISQKNLKVINSIVTKIDEGTFTPQTLNESIEQIIENTQEIVIPTPVPPASSTSEQSSSTQATQEESKSSSTQSTQEESKSSSTQSSQEESKSSSTQSSQESSKSSSSSSEKPNSEKSETPEDPDAQSSGDSNSLSGGAIAGIVIAVLVVVAAVVAFLVFYVFKKGETTYENAEMTDVTADQVQI